MNEQKICFILCTNNELYEKECISYIRKLNVPSGYAIQIIPIRGAVSMTAGYNQGMNQSDAKYKIYLHQDVFIIYQDFLTELLALFTEKSIGMVGMVGSLNFNESSVMWFGNRIGMLHSNSIFFSDSYLFGEVDGKYQEVEAVDGLLMATQYDIPWREDIFTGWDFYDASQSMEFRRSGYKVVVPATEKPWCIHDDGILNLNNYYQEREKYLKEYRDIIEEEAK